MGCQCGRSKVDKGSFQIFFSRKFLKILYFTLKPTKDLAAERKRISSVKVQVRQ